MTRSSSPSHPSSASVSTPATDRVRSPRSLASLALLAVLALVGVASLLTSDLGLAGLAEQAGLSDAQLRLVVLIQPAVLSLVAVLIGWRTSLRTGFRTPILDRGVSGVRAGALGAAAIVAVLAGALLVAYGYLTTEVFVLGAGDDVGTSLATRLLYGGITEEVLLRWGLMGLVAWLLLRFVPNAGSARGRWIWTANLIAAVLFALGHFPALALIAGATAIHYLLSFLINVAAGIGFGWTFARYGLEYAILAHAGTHLVAFGAMALLF